MMYADMLVDRGEMAAAVREADKLIEQAPENPPIIFVRRTRTRGRRLCQSEGDPRRRA